MIEALRLLFGAAERRFGVVGDHAKSQAVYTAALAFFAVATLDDWTWVVWSMVAAVICLVAFFLFRSKR